MSVTGTVSPLNDVVPSSKLPLRAHHKSKNCHFFKPESPNSSTYRVKISISTKIVNIETRMDLVEVEVPGPHPVEPCRNRRLHVALYCMLPSGVQRLSPTILFTESQTSSRCCRCTHSFVHRTTSFISLPLFTRHAIISASTTFLRRDFSQYTSNCST